MFCYTDPVSRYLSKGDILFTSVLLTVNDVYSCLETTIWTLEKKILHFYLTPPSSSFINRKSWVFFFFSQLSQLRCSPRFCFDQIPSLFYIIIIIETLWVLLQFEGNFEFPSFPYFRDRTHSLLSLELVFLRFRFGSSKDRDISSSFE